MNFMEILKANGIDDEVAGKITADMKSNRIFTAGEENLDIRYAKLKNEHATSTQTISDLQKQIAEYEALKVQNATLIEEANKKFADLQSENEKIKQDNALERALMEAKVQDVDYMKYKLKEKHPKALSWTKTARFHLSMRCLTISKFSFLISSQRLRRKLRKRSLKSLIHRVQALQANSSQR